MRIDVWFSSQCGNTVLREQSLTARVTAESFRKYCGDFYQLAVQCVSELSLTAAALLSNSYYHNKVRPRTRARQRRRRVLDRVFSGLQVLGMFSHELEPKPSQVPGATLSRSHRCWFIVGGGGVGD
jgi:hypothetical protein